MKTYTINTTGEGTKDDILVALKLLIASIESRSEEELEDATLEDATLCTEMSEDEADNRQHKTPKKRLTMKPYRVKLNPGHSAEPDQIKDGYLAFCGEICEYPSKKAAEKKALRFGGGTVEPVPGGGKLPPKGEAKPVQKPGSKIYVQNVMCTIDVHIAHISTELYRYLNENHLCYQDFKNDMGEDLMKADGKVSDFEGLPKELEPELAELLEIAAANDAAYVRFIT